MAPDPPSVVVLAGPNGAGKSTAAQTLLQAEFEDDQYVNADDLARGLSGFAPQLSAIEAGRLMLQQIKTLAARRATFAFETTLASRLFAQRLAAMRRAGYQTKLLFLHLESADLAVRRVRQRVSERGHDVAEAVIRRRYQRGLHNIINLYHPLMDDWIAYDNSGPVAIPVAQCSAGGSIEVQQPAVWESMERMSDA